MLREDPGFYLTNLHSWSNGNAFYGSFRTMRFLVKPTAVRDKESGELKSESTVEAFVGKGEYCMEGAVPLTEEGREQVIEWLEEQYKWITT